MPKKRKKRMHAKLVLGLVTLIAGLLAANLALCHWSSGQVFPICWGTMPAMSVHMEVLQP